ncbi:hypothetical protein JR065_18865 [Xanthomonas sp. AmX2]|uniref:hypothetical protein n=1 Tax=Xanthomonas sp. TaxID=29446 RepID=UPI00197EDA2E|nr:hypothetical protein [Xanthomonas sp.]MBN6152404.1 hypothetical protein [Xanthomonas sp.]
MEAWQTILLAITGNTLAVAAIAWLAKKFVDNSLQRNLQSHRAALESENQIASEKLRHDLAIVAQERSVVFSKLHERRAEVIAQIYALISDVVRRGGSFTSPIEMAGEPTKQEKYAQFADAFNALLEYFDKNKIYLPKDTCSKVDSLIDDIRSHAVRLNIGFLRAEDKSDTSGYHNMLDQWGKAWTYFKDQVPEVRGALEDDLRALVGND